ncbi:MAG TPA: tetratricopeptide repeat protein [Stellaceae bacterium]|jgi:protein O-GlcNAc transferase|nr:tetratricopeptide repeat protein [Stellaceae bacterium]
MQSAALFGEAQRHYQNGRLGDALQLCRRVLAGDPNHVDALYLTGFIGLQTGQPQVAVDVLQRAITLNRRVPDLHNSLGEALRALGRVDEAIACYRRALSLAPNDPTAHGCLGNAFLQQGKFVEAADAYRRAIGVAGNDPALHYNLGNALTSVSHLNEAMAAYRRALEIAPNYAEAHNNLGNAHRARGEPDAAIACYRRALAAAPNFALAHRNLGSMLMTQGQVGEAIAAFRRTVALAPQFPDAYCDLGAALRTQRDAKAIEEALASYERALVLKPDFADALANRGELLRELGRYEEAVRDFERLLAVAPGYDYAAGGLLHTKITCCDWADYDRLLATVENDVSAGKRAAAPFMFLYMSGSPREQLRCATTFTGDKIAKLPRSAKAPWRPHDRIRVAYVSGDFRNHPVAYLMAGLYEAHDRSRFETIALSIGPDIRDETRERLEKSFDRFIDAYAMTDQAAATLLCDNKVDIAVDMNGYSQGMRAGIFTRRPAPVQVSYLGFPGTMGADHIDYILADRFVIRENQQAFYAEKIVSLPDTYWPTDDRRKIGDKTLTRVEAGLPEQGFVFCSFNNNLKITPRIFDIWMRLLARVEGSVLWLLQDNETAGRNLRAEAAKRGVAPARLVFAPRVPLADHLARHRLADLVLDTLPYNAHTTASDALWASLPMLTCSGATFASRVGGSLLHAVGLPELVTDTLDDYEALALALAQDREKLGAIKAKLARNRDTFPLFDTVRLCRHIESAYETMVARHQRGEPPASFAVERIAG